MDEFLSVIGFIAISAIILGLVIYFTNNYSDKLDEERKENKELFKYVRNDYDFDPNLSDYENIKKILSNPKVRREAEEERRKSLRIRAANEERDKKNKILKRVFSYKYEELLYQLFSPFACKMDKPYRGQQWEIRGSIEADFIRAEISRIQNITYSEASQLLNEFIDNNLIELRKSNGFFYCHMGYLLYYDWDVISKEDQNFSSWMDSHPQVESSENFKKRENEFLINQARKAKKWSLGI